MELPGEIFEALSSEMPLERLAVRPSSPTDLILEERERGLFVALDRSGVVLDRSRDAGRMAARAADLIESLARPNLEGRLVHMPTTRFVVLPTAAIQLAAVQSQLERAGGSVPATVGWDLDMLEGAIVIAGPAEPHGSQVGLIAAVAASHRAVAHGQSALDQIAESVANVRAFHRHTGPPKNLRSLILSA